MHEARYFDANDKLPLSVLILQLKQLIVGGYQADPRLVKINRAESDFLS